MPILRKIELRHAENDMVSVLHQYHTKQEQHAFMKSKELHSKNINDRRLNVDINMHSNIVIFEEKLSTTKIDYSEGITYNYKIENKIHVISKDIITDIDYDGHRPKPISVTTHLITQFDCASFREAIDATNVIQIPKAIYNVSVAEPLQLVGAASATNPDPSDIVTNPSESQIISKYFTQVIKAVSYNLSVAELTTYSKCSIIVSLFKFLYHKFKVLSNYMNKTSNHNNLEFYINLISKENKKLAQVLSGSSSLLKYVLHNQIKISEANKTIPFYDNSFITYLETEQNQNKSICWPDGQLVVNSLDANSITVTMLL